MELVLIFRNVLVVGNYIHQSCIDDDYSHS